MSFRRFLGLFSKKQRANYEVEKAARAEAIRQAGHRQSKRTGNKTRLNRQRKPAQIRFR